MTIRDVELTPDVIEMSEEDFNKQYPNAFEIDNDGLYTNLPLKKFLLKSKNSWVGIDNTDKCAWCEDFGPARTNGAWKVYRKMAIMWLCDFKWEDWSNGVSGLFDERRK